MNQQEPTLSSIIDELAALRQENSAFRQQISDLHNQVTDLQAGRAVGETKLEALSTTRRGVLRKLAVGLMLGVGAATALGSNPPSADAKMTVDPVTNGLPNLVGAVIQRTGGSLSGSYSNSSGFGAIVYGDVGGFNVSTLPVGNFNYGVYAQSANYGVFGKATSTGGPNYGVYGTAAVSSSDSYGVYGDGGEVGVYGKTTGTTGNTYGIYGDGNSTSNSSYGVYGTGKTHGVYGYTTAVDGNGVTGVNGLSGTGSGTTNYGVQGISGSSTKTSGTYVGVYGTAVTQSGSAALGYGVFGSSEVGVYGRTTGNTSSDYGVHGVGNSGSSYAGYFTGNVFVTGTINKAAVGFKIDHPLHPDGKYLLHTSIESPDMLNLYNGLATLDETGEVVVTLPEWFEALNRDFRYQLTSVGIASPNLYIAQEIVANSFKIAGGVAGQKVSWQLTGIRQDAYANAYRMPIEQDKDEKERGMYLHPELFDKSSDFQIGVPRQQAPVAPVM